MDVTAPLVCQYEPCRKVITRYGKKFCSLSCGAKEQRRIERLAAEGQPKPSGICLGCGQSFFYGKNSKKKFCSRSCAASHNNRGVTRRGTHHEGTCANCGELITGSGRKYCSRKCMGEHVTKSFEDTFLSGGRSNVSPGILRKYVRNRDGWRCSLCGLTEWANQPTPLVLDHIDGNATNNEMENLRLVCPNCDAQLPTFTGRNYGNGRHYRRVRYREGKSF